jgi:3-deoxy-D-manno-octulosonic-acid transferase
MYFLYSLCLSILFITLLPYFLYQALRHGKYSGSLIQRLGRLPEAIRNDGRETVWVHAVSVGEFLAARVLIDRISLEFPDWRIIVSTTTLTGQLLAKSQSRTGTASVFYFPFDWMFVVRRVLDYVKPRVVILLETELWPNFIRECRKRGIATILANGRISLRSFDRYKIVRRLMSRVLADISLIVMQSAADVTRILELGAQSRKVRLCGNLKYDTAPVPSDHLPAASWLRGGDTRSLIVAGSTAAGEEQVLLSALQKIREQPLLRNCRLLVAPRHPERFEEVAVLIERSGFTLARRSEIKSLEREGSTADIILLDTIGELAGLYRYGAVVFVGGSLVPKGGHNVIEPAAWARPIVVGPHTENFRQIVNDFLQAEALIQIENDGRSPSDSLAIQIIRLLTDRQLAEEMGERALTLLKANRGAADCTLRAIKEVLAHDQP